MKSIANAPVDRRPDWFVSWFDSPYYPALYAHRNDEEANRFIDALVERFRPAPGSTALDLGCGTGRHSRRLAARGFDVTGLDLSAESLREADRHRQEHLRFVRRDMRMRFGTHAFDYVFNLFTSFGYFDDPSDNLTVLRNVVAALKPGGRLVLDYLNVRCAEMRLRPHEEVERAGVAYRITRSIEEGFFVKRIVVEDPRIPAPPFEHVERVARFALSDFEFIFELSGLRVEAICGDYNLSPFDPETSPRLILIAQPADDPDRLPARQLFADAADRLR